MLVHKDHLEKLDHLEQRYRSTDRHAAQLIHPSLQLSFPSLPFSQLSPSLSWTSPSVLFSLSTLPLSLTLSLFTPHSVFFLCIKYVCINIGSSWTSRNFWTSWTSWTTCELVDTTCIVHYVLAHHIEIRILGQWLVTRNPTSLFSTCLSSLLPFRETLVPQVPKESRDKVESPDPKEYPESQANLECPAHRETRDQLGHLALVDLLDWAGQKVKPDPRDLWVLQELL